MGLRLLVAYDGTRFAGFQAQPDQRTVQGVLEDALFGLADEAVAVRVAGRTDAGVHALGQVVSVPAVGRLEPDMIMRALPGCLPADVSVLDAQWAPDDFDARRSATWRAYVYLIWNHEARHPLFHPYSLWVRERIDVEALGKALRVVAGTHDFRSFARVREDQSPVRTVHEVTCTHEDPFIRIRIVGESFLHQMVRSIVGSALEVGRGRRQLSWMREALLAAERAAAGPVALPQGLTLTEVGYDDVSWPRRTPIGWPWSSSVQAADEVVGGIR